MTLAEYLCGNFEEPTNHATGLSHGIDGLYRVSDFDAVICVKKARDRRMLTGV